MTELGQVFEMLRRSDRILITRNKKKLWFGFLANLVGPFEFKPENHVMESIGLDGHEAVVAIRPHSEYRHPKWLRKGLLAPLMPEETPDYNFRDLQETFYFELVLA